MMDLSILQSIMESIEEEKWKQIKLLMKADGASYQGFANFEKVPTTFITNACLNQERSREGFLKAAIETYIGLPESQIEGFPKINGDNFIGVICLMLFRNADIETIQNAMIELKQSSNNDENFSSNNENIVNNGVKKMSVYLGYLDVSGSYSDKFYNFYPLYEYVGSRFEKLSNCEERFPEYGNFAVYSNDRYYDKEIDLKNREFCIIQLDENDITENINPFTGQLKGANYKIYIDDIAKANKLHSLSEYNLYPIVTAIDEEIDFSKRNIIDITEYFPINKYMTKVVLYYKGEYYGPFETGYRNINDKVYINTRIAENKYLINKINFDDDSDPVLYCEYAKSKDFTDFLFLDDNASKETIDVADDEILMASFSETLNLLSSEAKLSKDNLPKLLQQLKVSPFADLPDNDEISKKRIERFNFLISNITKAEDMANKSSELITGVFANMDDENKKEFIKHIINSPDFLKGLQNHEIVVGKIREKEEQLEKLNKEYLELQENIKSQQENIKEGVLANLEEKSLKAKELEEDINSKQKELDSITNKLGLSQEIDKLQVLHTHYQSKFQGLEKTIDEKINSACDSATKLIFDDQFDNMISLKMSEAFSMYQKNCDEDCYRKIAEKTIVKNSVLSKDELINSIVTEVQKYRPLYDKNTILNMLICITQGFLTIFSGEPGTGKTSICKILGHILGLDHPLYQSDSSINTKRFSCVAVERGWNSKKDLIGYYNPLSKRMEKSNSSLYDSLRILNAESNKSAYPMIILLDEANLSPMEYYWADFVNISDDIDNKVVRELDLGDSQKIHIPSTLRFLATINNDHTTENISPRLIDRAFVISLPVKFSDKAKKLATDEDVCQIVSWENLKNTFDAFDTNSMESQANSIYEKIKFIFAEMNQSISPRVEGNIKRYCSVAQNIFESNSNVAPSIIALDYAIAQKVITKISGSGENYRKSLENLHQYCKEQNLTMTSNQLERIIRNGEKSMDYYEFFC